jgi:hypothetical protein
VGADFLAVTISLLDTDVVNAGDSLHFQIKVTDPLGFPKLDATVNASLDQSLDSPAGVSPVTGTATEMSEITFTAPVASLLPLDETQISLTIDATYPGFYNGTATLGMVMVKLYQTCWNGNRIPNDQTCPARGLPALEITITIGVISMIAVVYAVVRKRKA